MVLFINELLNSAATIGAMLLLPVIWWFATARGEWGFFSWIGLKGIQTENKASLLLWLGAATVMFGLTGLLLHWVVKGNGTVLATSRFFGLGWVALPAIVVCAAFSTSLWEECLFRGFLLKRLAHHWNFSIGNMLQAAVFGLMHGVMFFASAGTLRAVAVTILTGTIGWGLGYLNEKQADGSIFPSWAIHALSNLVAGTYAAFAT